LSFGHAKPTCPEDGFDLAISLWRCITWVISARSSRVFRALGSGGRFIFSVEHPVITSCDRAWQAGGARQDWIVDNYFDTGPRTTNWMGGELLKYHHTVEDFTLGLQEAGFVVERLRESRPVRERFTEPETYARRMRIPLFLFLAVRKPGVLRAMNRSIGQQAGISEGDQSFPPRSGTGTP
jgi:hypothetical protein